MIDPRELGPYGRIAEQVQSPLTMNALEDLAHAPADEYRGVFLGARSRRDTVLDRTYDSVDGMFIVAAGVDEEGKLAVKLDMVTPEGMDPTAFLELCRDLNMPLAKPLVMDMGGLLLDLAGRGRSLASGISILSDTDSEVGMPLLYVPKHYTEEGYDHIASDNPDHEHVVTENRKALSTNTSSSICDYMLGLSLGEIK